MFAICSSKLRLESSWSPRSRVEEAKVTSIQSTVTWKSAGSLSQTQALPFSFVHMLTIHLTQFQNKRSPVSEFYEALNCCFNNVYDVFVLLSRDHILLKERRARSKLVHSYETHCAHSFPQNSHLQTSRFSKILHFRLNVKKAIELSLLRASYPFLLDRSRVQRPSMVFKKRMSMKRWSLHF